MNQTERKARPVTVRLTDDLQIQLETLAKFDGVTLAAEIRAGIDLLLQQKQHDRAFRERVAESLERTKLLLARLDDSEDIGAALGSVNEVAARELERV